ncbi:MAG: transposase family protein [Caldilineaceae bacterium]|nr:transposase family protein [Caldilineaceae bacterium]
MSAVPVPLVSLPVGVDVPHRLQRQHHFLEAILLFATLAVICGANNWTEVEYFGHQKQTWLETFLDLPYDILSHDTFGRVFGERRPAPIPETSRASEECCDAPCTRSSSSETAATLCKLGLVSEAEFGKHDSWREMRQTLQVSGLDL